MTENYYRHIISVLPKCDLEDYPPELFMRFAEHGALLRRDWPWCRELSEEMFLSWVLCPRVNNEELSDCRELFYKELAPRVKDLSLTEAILEANRWCAENVTYRSTDIRTASALSVYESGCGRCGEESMFAVNALRSIGIAARQVYAPWWSHCDDNHAWVEAYDGNSWRFLGACEPEPRPDLGWFLPAAGRAMLCHAKCFVGDNEDWERLLPGEDLREVDLREGVAYISVTQRYAKVRPFTVHITDAAGNSLTGATVEYYVLNEGLLRRIAQRVTDSQGRAIMSLGLGSVWVTARQGDMSAEFLVNTAETGAVELSLPQRDSVPASFDFLPPEGSSVKPLALSEPERLKRQEALNRAKELYDSRHPGGGSVPKKPGLWPWERFPAGEVPELWQDGSAHDTSGPVGKLTLCRGQGKGAVGLMRWKEGWWAVTMPPGTEAELPAGKYRLITSVRLPSGAQLGRLTDFTLAPDEPTELAVSFRKASPNDLLQKLPLPDPGFSFRGPALLCWIDPGAEPTEHLLNELKAFGEFPCPIHFICRQPKAAFGPGITPHPWEEYAAETMARRLFQEPGHLPLAVLADKEGSARFVSAGYNVGLIELAAELCGLIKITEGKVFHMQNETLNVLKTRRSVRKYKPDQVDPETLNAILEAGTYAPSGMGKQPSVIVAVQSPEDRKAVMELNKKARGGSGDPYYGAPTIVLVLADSNITGTFVEDGTCVLNTMMAAAHSLGVSSCWIHGEHLMFDLPEGKALLKKWGLPEDLRGVGSLALGYAEGQPPQPKPRKEGYIKIV